MVRNEVVIQVEADILVALSNLKQALNSESFSPIDQQKVLVSASELMRNVIDHADADGMMFWEICHGEIRISVIDHGTGIVNCDEIVNGSARSEQPKGLGIGLSGTRRLMDDFFIESSEKGTHVFVAKRKSSLG